MNLYPDASLGFRATTPTSLPSSLNLNSPARPRLPPHINEELSRLSPSDHAASPTHQKLSLPSFLPSPARLLQHLPASPASLLLSPIRRRTSDRQPPSNLLSNDDDTNLIEQIDDYFLRRRQYLQHNIDVSLNISRWLLENMVFYSIETLR